MKNHYTPLQKMRTFLAHIRWTQLSFHLAATASGTILAVFTTNTPFHITTHFIIAGAILSGLVAASWIASVMINDYHDCAIDHISNANRPLPSGAIAPETYKFSSLFFHVTIPIVALFINPIVALFLMAYLAISFAYNAPPLRLKRFPIIGTFTIGLALQMTIFAGFALIAPNHITHTYPFTWGEIFIALGIFALIAPIKDFKDVTGDSEHGISTIPILFGPIGARLIISIGIIALVLRLISVANLSPIITLSLFFCAIAAILILFASAFNTLIKERLLLAWLFLPAIVFALSIAIITII